MARFSPDYLRSKTAAYGDAIDRRRTAQGVKEDGSWVNPFTKGTDGNYAANPWLDAYNQNPWRGSQKLTNFEGEKERVAGWQSNSFYNANLSGGMFNTISNQIEDLQREFQDTLFTTTNAGNRLIASVSDVDPVSIEPNPRYGSKGRTGTQRYRVV